MTDRPYQPFYKPYGMNDEDYEYEKRIAAEKLEKWEQEQEEAERLKTLREQFYVLFTEPNPLGSGKEQSKLFKTYPDEVWTWIEEQSEKILLQKCYEVLGWQDGTIDQVKRRIKQLLTKEKAINAAIKLFRESENRFSV